MVQKLCKTRSYISVTDLQFQKVDCFSDFSIGEQIKQIPSLGEGKERILTFASRTNNRQKENNFLEFNKLFCRPELGLNFRSDDTG